MNDETISKKLAANEVLNAIKFYSYFMYFGVFSSFFVLMLYIFDSQSGMITAVVSSFAFVYATWKAKSTMNMLKNKYGL